MPQEMLEAFNLTDMPDFSQIEEYFAYVFQIYPPGQCYSGGGHGDWIFGPGRKRWNH